MMKVSWSALLEDAAPHCTILAPADCPITGYDEIEGMPLPSTEPDPNTIQIR